MAEKRRGSYTPEFRQKAADLALASDVRMGDIAKTLNLVPSTLSNWVARRKRQLNEPSLENQQVPLNEQLEELTPKGKNQQISPQVEIENLKREVQRLKRERKVVKEAILLLTT